MTLHFEDDGGQGAAGFPDELRRCRDPEAGVRLQRAARGMPGRQRRRPRAARRDVHGARRREERRDRRVGREDLGLAQEPRRREGLHQEGARRPRRAEARRDEVGAMEVELRRGSKTRHAPDPRRRLSTRRWTSTSRRSSTGRSRRTSRRRAPARGLGPGRGRRGGAPLRARARPRRPIATAKKGAVLPVDAQMGEFYRVEWQKGRFAFVPDAEVKRRARPALRRDRRGVAARAPADRAPARSAEGRARRRGRHLEAAGQRARRPRRPIPTPACATCSCS